MKNLIIYLTLSLFICGLNSVQAQSNSDKKEGTPKSASNALSYDLNGANKKDAEKIWKDLVKQLDGKTKKGKNNEWYTQKISLPKIGPDGSVKMYMKMEEKEDMIRSIFLVTKDGEFINVNDYPEEAVEAEKIFQTYVDEFKEKTTENNLEQQEKTLKNLTKDLSKLQKNNSKYHSEIEKCKKKIEEMESKIAKNEDDQDTKEEEIDAQKIVVEKVMSKLHSMQKSQ